MEMSGAPSDSFLGGLFRTASEGNIARRGGWKRAKVKAKPAPKPKVARAPYVVPSPMRDQVAEHLSNELDFEQIAERMGLTVKAVRRHFEKIRRDLGVQAV
jgi:DNA-binding NarL/FixJ family response regulator